MVMKNNIKSINLKIGAASAMKNEYFVINSTYIECLNPTNDCLHNVILTIILILFVQLTEVF